MQDRIFRYIHRSMQDPITYLVFVCRVTLVVGIVIIILIGLIYFILSLSGINLETTFLDVIHSYLPEVFGIVITVLLIDGLALMRNKTLWGYSENIIRDDLRLYSRTAISHIDTYLTATLTAVPQKVTEELLIAWEENFWVSKVERVSNYTTSDLEGIIKKRIVENNSTLASAEDIYNDAISKLDLYSRMLNAKQYEALIEVATNLTEFRGNMERFWPIYGLRNVSGVDMQDFISRHIQRQSLHLRRIIQSLSRLFSGEDSQ